jgi:adenosine deaminase
MPLTNIDPSLPFIDLHRHLDGNVRLDTILDIGRKHNLPLPAWDLEGLRPYVQVTVPQPGVMSFIDKFYWMMQALVDYDACRRVAYENVLDASAEGLDYIELRFSPWFMAEQHSLDVVGVAEAVCSGVAKGQEESGLWVNLIGIISRTYGPEVGWKELQALLTQRERIIGLDLAGDEAHFPAVWYSDHFHQGRDAGWQITVHAGEIAGPESVWSALRDLGAQRLGHAVAAVQDPALMETLAERRIGIESNLTSNVQTMTVSSYAAHPISEFLKHGLQVTLNTDDPGISAIDLQYEYNIAAPAAGLSMEQIHQVQANALEVAFLSADEKKKLVDRVKNKRAK